MLTDAFIALTINILAYDQFLTIIVNYYAQHVKTKMHEPSAKYNVHYTTE